MTYSEQYELVGIEIVELRNGFCRSEGAFEDEVFDHYMLLPKDVDSVWEVIARVPEERAEYIKDHPQYTVVDTFHVFNPIFLGNGSSWSWSGISRVLDQLTEDAEYLGEDELDRFEKRLAQFLEYAKRKGRHLSDSKRTRYFITTLWKYWEDLDEDGLISDNGIEFMGFVNYDSLMRSALTNMDEWELGVDVVTNAAE